MLTVEVDRNTVAVKSPSTEATSLGELPWNSMSPLTVYKSSNSLELAETRTRPTAAVP